MSLSVSNRGLEIHGHGMFPPPPKKKKKKKEQNATAVQGLAGRRLERRGA